MSKRGGSGGQPVFERKIPAFLQRMGVKGESRSQGARTVAEHVPELEEREDNEEEKPVVVDLDRPLDYAAPEEDDDMLGEDRKEEVIGGVGLQKKPAKRRVIPKDESEPEAPDKKKTKRKKKKGKIMLSFQDEED